MAQKKGKRAPAKSARSKSTPKLTLVNSAHQIWLAGLGALGRAQSEGPKLFESLAAEGSKIHESTRKQAEQALSGAISGVRSAIDSGMENVRDKATETWDNIEKIFESRVQTALQQLGVPTAREIHSLSRKVDELTRSVEALRHSKKRSDTGVRATSTALQRKQIAMESGNA